MILLGSFLVLSKGANPAYASVVTERRLISNRFVTVLSKNHRHWIDSFATRLKILHDACAVLLWNDIMTLNQNAPEPITISSSSKAHELLNWADDNFFSSSQLATGVSDSKAKAVHSDALETNSYDFDPKDFARTLRNRFNDIDENGDGGLSVAELTMFAADQRNSIHDRKVAEIAQNNISSLSEMSESGAGHAKDFFGNLALTTAKQIGVDGYKHIFAGDIASQNAVISEKDIDVMDLMNDPKAFDAELNRWRKYEKLNAGYLGTLGTMGTAALTWAAIADPEPITKAGFAILAATTAGFDYLCWRGLFNSAEPQLRQQYESRQKMFSNINLNPIARTF